MSVPGIRLPCLAGEASATAASNRESIPARLNRATARDAAPYARTVRPAARFLFEPAPQRFDVLIGAALEAADGSRIGDAQRILGREDAQHRLVGFGLPVYGCEQHRSAVQVELPCGDNPHARPRRAAASVWSASSTRNARAATHSTGPARRS